MTSSSRVLRTKIVTRMSGRTSRSNTKFTPAEREITSNTLRMGASRNSRVIGLASARLTFGSAEAACARRSATARMITRAPRWLPSSASTARAFASAVARSPRLSASSASRTIASSRRSRASASRAACTDAEPGAIFCARR